MKNSLDFEYQPTNFAEFDRKKANTKPVAKKTAPKKTKTTVAKKTKR